MSDLPKKNLLLVIEVAEYFRVVPRTVYLWMEHGKLEKTVTPGGAVRVTRKSVIKWQNHIRKKEK